MTPEEKKELWDFAKDMALNILKYNEGMYASKNSTFRIKVTNEIMHRGKMETTPTRRDHLHGIIEINKHIFVKLDDTTRIMSILWSALRSSKYPVSLDGDLKADKDSLDFLLERDYDFEKGKFAIRYTRLIREKSATSEDYKTARIRRFLEYYYEKTGHPRAQVPSYWF